MQVGSSLFVDANNYASAFKLLEKDLLYMHREIRCEKEFSSIDVFGACWSFTIGKVDRDLTFAKRHGKYVEVSSSAGLAVFLPPFSVVDWHVKPGNIQFYTYFSTRLLPVELPKEPVIFKSDADFTEPKNVNDIFEIMQNPTSKFISIGREEQVSAIARKTKELIDKTYSEEISISEIAVQINCSHEVMSRAFKRCYGISPVDYRKKLRVTDSLRLMLINNYSVTEAALNVGFNDAAQFQKQFKTLQRLTPSKFTERSGSQNL